MCTWLLHSPQWHKHALFSPLQQDISNKSVNNLLPLHSLPLIDAICLPCVVNRHGKGMPARVNFLSYYYDSSTMNECMEFLPFFCPEIVGSNSLCLWGGTSCSPCPLPIYGSISGSKITITSITKEISRVTNWSVRKWSLNQTDEVTVWPPWEEDKYHV